MRLFAAGTLAPLAVAALLLCGCSGDEPVPTAPVSAPNAGKAAFNESKAIEKAYHAGYTNITLRPRDRDGVWRGNAIRRGSGAPAAIAVTENGPVVAR
jgi:hypothetical protein